MARVISKAYFENRQEQNNIEAAVLNALPVDVYYHNLIIVFSRMLTRFTEQAFNDDVFARSTKDKMTGA